MALTRRPLEDRPVSPSSYSKPLKASRLYSNDFDALLKFLRDGDGRTLTIRAGKTAVIENAADLQELKYGERNDLRISVTNPSVTIRLQFDSKVSTTDLASTDAKKLVDDVHKLFETWRAPSARFINLGTLVPGGGGLILASLAALALFIFRGVDNLKENQALPWTLLIFAATFALIGSLSAGTRVTVSPRTRHAASERRVQAFGAAAIAIVAGVVGSVVTWLLTR